MRYIETACDVKRSDYSFCLADTDGYKALTCMQEVANGLKHTRVGFISFYHSHQVYNGCIMMVYSKGVYSVLF